MKSARDSSRFLLGILVIGIAAWTAVAQLVIPAIIEQAYRGESLNVFNSVISGRHIYPVEFYLRHWQVYYWLVVVVLVASWALYRQKGSIEGFFQRVVEESTPGTLGATRSFVAFILLFSTLWEDTPSIAFLPLEMRRPMGVLQWLYSLPIGFEGLHSSYTALVAFKYLTVGLLILSAIGLWTRLVVPCGAVCYLVYVGLIREYSWFYHTGLIPLYLLLALSFMPCADGWSVDRILRVARGQRVPDVNKAYPIYGWSRYICWVLLALPYVAAGLSKFRFGGLVSFPVKRTIQK